MDTMDRSDSNVPARYSSNSFRAPAPLSLPPRDLAIASTPQVSPQVILRGINRHWWRILLLWLVVSTPLAYVIYLLFEPTYEAFSLLQVEPTKEFLFTISSQNLADMRAYEPYLLTQVRLITSDRVLDAALSTDPKIAKLPMIKQSEDPKVDLRKQMVVGIVDRHTYLIRVALASGDPEEAAMIVNAVVDAYMAMHTAYHRSANKALHQSLDDELDKLTGEILAKKAELKGLVENGNVRIEGFSKMNAVKDDDPGIKTMLPTVTEEQYTRTANTLLQTEMELLEARANLEAAQGQLEIVKKAIAGGQTQESADELAARVKEEFLQDPEVVGLAARINSALKDVDKVKSLVRQPHDPARLAAEQNLRELKDDWDMAWDQKYEKIERRLLAEDETIRPELWERKIAEVTVNIEKLKKQKDSLGTRLENLKLQDKKKNSDTLSASMVNQELGSLLKMKDIIGQKLEQLRFEEKQDVYRITPHDRAGVPKVPSNNKRLKYMAAAPVGILFLLLGLFLFLEIRSERVADPDALSLRMQSEVYALPPLPTARSIRKRSPAQADDQIEQFIQRLDHLRFAVCGNPADLEKGRCVLITSAIGREGKTTLAAQLAARCGNAGMSTLLIDADLRRTGLCSLLDVPEGPGLSDALIHDDPPATDLVIPVQGGTFHLLPAGTPTPDANRVLQNRKLGLLVTQFRQIYDLVIIDSPPVLPVPDALILGRWADGAVLAVRYDTSRFPQVERARRQLDSAGICVLWTVINGMRNSDSYYGGYSYSRRPTPQPDSTAAI
jgi:polysaccharide biosynthesis transport protein